MLTARRSQPLSDPEEVDHAIDAIRNGEHFIGKYPRNYALDYLVTLLLPDLVAYTYTNDVPDIEALHEGRVSYLALLDEMVHVLQDGHALNSLEQRAATALVDAAQVGLAFGSGRRADDAEIEELRTALYAYCAEKHRLATYAANAQKPAARKGGTAPKRRIWAEKLAERLCADHPELPGRELLALVPESRSPLTISGWEIHRDEERIVAVRDQDGQEQGMSVETFRTRYLRKKKT